MTRTSVKVLFAEKLIANILFCDWAVNIGPKSIKLKETTS